MAAKILVQVGDVYNRFTVLLRRGGHCQVRCVCGVVKWVRTDKLRSGETKSCGCLAKELADASRKPHPAPVPKMSADERRVRAVHTAMMQRCFNQNNADYKTYGARGIGVCLRWRDKDTFVADLLPTYRRGKWLERVDNDLGYEPSNAVWASPKRQGRNRVNTLYVDGVPLSAFAAHHGVPYTVAYREFKKYGTAAAIRRHSTRWRVDERSGVDYSMT